MKINTKSQRDLIASLQLCTQLNKTVSKVIFSKFNLLVLSFLCDRGFVTNFKFVKKGFNGYIAFSLRQINGSLVFSNIWSPYLVSSSKKNCFVKYHSYRSLLKSFSSEFVIVSTSLGLMTANEAISAKLGGLVVCVIR